MNVFVLTLLAGGLVFAIGLTAGISGTRAMRRRAKAEKALAAKS